MKRPGQPTLSAAASQDLVEYQQHLRDERDVSPATLRSYLPDLRRFVAWFEAIAQGGEGPFTPQALTTPALTRYRAHLQTVVKLKAAGVPSTVIIKMLDHGASKSTVSGG